MATNIASKKEEKKIQSGSRSPSLEKSYTDPQHNVQQNIFNHGIFRYRIFFIDFVVSTISFTNSDNKKFKEKEQYHKRNGD
jgi:hypothetical protein